MGSHIIFEVPLVMDRKNKCTMTEIIAFRTEDAPLSLRDLPEKEPADSPIGDDR